LLNNLKCKEIVHSYLVADQSALSFATRPLGRNNGMYSVAAAE